MSKPIDHDAVRDVTLSLINDGRFREQVLHIRRNLTRKVKRGVYDPALAARPWRHAAEHYMSLPYYAGEPLKLNVPTRDAIGRELERDQREYVYGDAGVEPGDVPTFPSDVMEG